MAAGTHIETAKLYLSTDNFGDHSLAPEEAAVKSRDSVQVEVKRLDDLVPASERENLFLWLDTQGYEGFVLQGAAGILEQGPPLVLEFCPEMLAQTQARAALLKAVVDAPYALVYDLGEANPAPMPVTKEVLDQLFEAYLEKNEFTDLFFAP